MNKKLQLLILAALASYQIIACGVVPAPYITGPSNVINYNNQDDNPVTFRLNMTEDWKNSGTQNGCGAYDYTNWYLDGNRIITKSETCNLDPDVLSLGSHELRAKTHTVNNQGEICRKNFYYTFTVSNQDAPVEDPDPIPDLEGFMNYNIPSSGVNEETSITVQFAVVNTGQLLPQDATAEVKFYWSEGNNIDDGTAFVEAKTTSFTIKDDANNLEQVSLTVPDLDDFNRGCQDPWMHSYIVFHVDHDDQWDEGNSESNNIEDYGLITINTVDDCETNGGIAPNSRSITLEGDLDYNTKTKILKVVDLTGRILWSNDQGVEVEKVINNIPRGEVIIVTKIEQGELKNYKLFIK